MVVYEVRKSPLNYMLYFMYTYNKKKNNNSKWTRKLEKQQNCWNKTSEDWSNGKK